MTAGVLPTLQNACRWRGQRQPGEPWVTQACRESPSSNSGKTASSTKLLSPPTPSAWSGYSEYPNSPRCATPRPLILNG